MGKESTVVTVIRDDRPNMKTGEACLVVINGADLGKRHPLTRLSTVIGRSSKTDIQIDDESISRNHAMIVNRGDRYLLKDLGSTNGTYVNDRPTDEIDLRDGDLVKIGRTIFKFLSGQNIESAYHEEIYRLTTTDGLTQIYNKRFFIENLEREMSRCLRYARDLSLVMFDIDHFKNVNDTFGHLTGDAVLKQLAQRIQTAIRRDDIFARYGGEEFTILTPEVPKEGALHLAEKLRGMVASKPFNFDGVDVPITISLGVADLRDYVHEFHQGELPTDFDALELIRMADKQLYQAKNRGRNRVAG
ncbi:MAG: GGDEF domain-containing protein [Bradymonadales bacterium]|nr:GGDEF domain-containing protein [Bradymonadales bacterium]